MSADELPTASRDVFASLSSWNKNYQYNYCGVVENLLNSLSKGEIQRDASDQLVWFRVYGVWHKSFEAQMKDA